MHNRTALITGASQGIGRETAITLAKEGYRVAFTYLSNDVLAEDTLRALSAHGQGHCRFQCDARDLGAMRTMTDEVIRAFGHIDLLVNNVGITKHLPFLEATEELWDDITFTDWRCAYFLSQWVARNMVATATRGVIVNITSIHQDCCFPYSNIYGPTKAALEKFTQNAALELAPHGIRVVAVSPGCILVRENQGGMARAAALSSRIPLGRMGTAAEIAATIAFLASDAAGYITGACINVDGGALLPTHLDNVYTEQIPAWDNGDSSPIE